MFLLTAFNMVILIILIAYIFYRLVKTKSIITLFSFSLQLSALTIVLLALINGVNTSNLVEVFYLVCGIVIPCGFLTYDFRSMIKKVKEKGSFDGFITLSSNNAEKYENTAEVMKVIVNESFVNDTVSELGYMKEELLKSIRRKLVQAEQLYNEGDYDDAFDIYDNLIDVIGPSSNLYFNYANLSFHKGRYSEAQTYYRKVLELNQQLIENLKKKPQSAGSSEIISNIKFKQYLVYYNIGVTYLNLGKLDFALENFEKALQLNPEFNIAKEGIGRIFTEKGNKLEAVKYYEDILDKDSSNYVISLLLGKLFIELDKNDEAEECFRKCIRLAPENSEAYSELGKLLMSLKSYDQAVKVYKAYIAMNDLDFNGHYNLAGCYMRLGDLSRAAHEYDRAISLNPNSPNCLYNLALVYEDMGELEKASGLYKSAILLKIDFSDAYNNLGILFSKLQSPMEAIATYTNGLKACPGDYRLYYNMGVVLFEMRRYEDASDAYKRAIELNPDDSDIYYYLGAALTETKRYDQAIKAYSKALNHNLSEAELFYNIAAVYALMKKYDIAMDNIKRAISINPAIKQQVYVNNVFDPIQSQLLMLEEG